MDEHVIRTYVRQEPRFVGGDGAIVLDEHGTQYLDLLGGIGVNVLGHGHPRLVPALQDQVGRLMHTSNLYRHEYTEAVAAKIAQATGLHATFFCNSGAEATEGALKAARKHQRNLGHTHRTGFVALQGGFHGRTLGAISVTAHEPYRAPFEPVVPGVTFVPHDDVAALEAALATEPAALILEPIQGEGGVRALTPDFLRAARQLCDATGTVLIHDEVQCGVARTGTFLAGEHAGITPDIATLAKPLAAGIPIGAVVVREALAEALVPGDHGSTFGGNPLACRAALVVLDELENGLAEAVAARGAEFRDGLEAIAARHSIVTEVRGRGLMIGLRLAHGAPDLNRALFDAHVLANCTAGDVLRLLPPYVITAEQVLHALELIERGVADLANASPTA